MRVIRLIRNILAIIGAVWLCGLLYAEVRSVITLSFPWVWEEKMRVPAPSGVCDFVLYEGNRGAMSSFEYACFLVAHGERIDPKVCDPYEPLLVNSRIPPQGSWQDNRHLIIRFKGGACSASTALFTAVQCRH